MNFNTVEFKASYATPDQIPLSLRPEIVFAGRSNVGKSSLLNRLFNRKRLAKVSQTPGKTAAVNFFTAEELKEALIAARDADRAMKSGADQDDAFLDWVESSIVGS